MLIDIFEFSKEPDRNKSKAEDQAGFVSPAEWILYGFAARKQVVDVIFRPVVRRSASRVV